MTTTQTQFHPLGRIQGQAEPVNYRVEVRHQAADEFMKVQKRSMIYGSHPY